MSLSCLIRRTLTAQRLINLPAVATSSLTIFPRVDVPIRFLALTRPLKSAEPEKKEEENPEKESSGNVADGVIKGRIVEKIPVETSIRYLQSKAYSITYGEDPVWKNYRRNFKGQIPPRKTRKKCIRTGKVATGNPCPLCRDDYLVVSPENVELLKQFISPHTGETISFKITGVCQKKQKELLSAIDIAKDSGALTFDVPFRLYDYSDYKK
ncbi:hypothetical protein GE061_011557 [Apolygus lucorum]|uniref:Small ribosomal subunit protein mS40 n=1 Tax=Apolygus lucorum TaxID=248454 RepID=A0A8S9Y1V5_APOLU|nr:hypothetical protein GE061_011557 [Apolygus lucorum]